MKPCNFVVEIAISDSVPIRKLKSTLFGCRGILSHRTVNVRVYLADHIVCTALVQVAAPVKEVPVYETGGIEAL